MKRFLIPMLLMSLLLFAGCSGLIASKSMSATIDANAVLGQTQIAKATTQPYTAAEAAPLISANTQAFTLYRTSATGNPFAYLLGSKNIWVNSTYYTLLNQTSALSDAFPKWSATMTETEINGVLAWQDNRLIDVKKAKDGSK